MRFFSVLRSRERECRCVLGERACSSRKASTYVCSACKREYLSVFVCVCVCVCVYIYVNGWVGKFAYNKIDD
jgi:hypothetical protein